MVRAQQLLSFIDRKREETEQMMTQQQEEEKNMQEKNDKLNSLFQNVASSILTNDNGVINVENETDDSIVVDSDNISVVVVKGNEGDGVDSNKEEDDNDDEEDNNDGGGDDVGVGTMSASL